MRLHLAVDLIDTRLAADLLGATPMDRPEDVKAAPHTGKVYVLLTNNAQRKADRTDKANPRPENLFGHIIELSAPDGDHAAEKFAWEILLKCGDPRHVSTSTTACRGCRLSPA